MRIRSLIVACVLVSLATAASAQQGLRGQIFLPNGEPLIKTIRYTLATTNGVRSEVYFTDSHGRIEINQPVNVPYSVTVQGDGETFETTTLYFDPAYSGRYIQVHLRPITKSSFTPGVVDASKVDQSISPQAKELYDTATKLLAEQKYEQALEPLKRAVAIQPNYFGAYNDLGVINLRLKRYDDAADAFRHAIKINNRAYLPQLNLGIVLNRQKKHKEAAEILFKLQQDKPDLGEMISVPLVEALLGSQQWSAAEIQIRKALGYEQSDVVDLKLKLGTVLIRQAKYEAAVTVLDEAVKAEPDNALVLFNLGAALLEVGKLDESEARLRRAYEIKGAEMAGAQLVLGELYFKRKNYPKAAEAFRAYLRDMPGAPNAAQVKDAIAAIDKALKK